MVTTKKNTDYSASAINITNPPEVESLLAIYKTKLGQIDQLDATLHAYPEYEDMTRVQQEMAELRKDIEKTIEQYGSYQDLDRGWYGVKQKAVSVSYLPTKIHDVLPPQIVAAVIVESVDKSTVEALAKAGRITPEQQELISEKKETYRYIIR